MPKEAKKRGKKTVKSKTKTSAKTVKKTAKKNIDKISKPKTKKTVKKAVPKLQNAPQGKEFFLINGKKVKNYEELAKIMEDLEDHVFHHHVNPTKNDFSNWVRDVFNDIELAKKIAGLNKKEHLELVLYRRIVRGK